MREINKIIIHCSGTNIETYDFDRMHYDHTNNRGWSDIGYHFGIDFSGRYHILRPIHRSGAHAKGHNTDSIGICLLGLDPFTRRQFQQLATLLEMLCTVFDLKEEDIYPHNHFNKNKTCPNFDVDWFKDQFLELPNGV